MDMAVETFRTRHVARRELMAKKVRLLTDLRSFEVEIIGLHGGKSEAAN